MNHTASKRVRRRAKKMARQASSRQRVEDNRDYIRSFGGAPTECERSDRQRTREAEVIHSSRRTDRAGNATPPTEERTPREPMVRRPEVHVFHPHQATQFPPRHPKKAKSADGFRFFS